MILSLLLCYRIDGGNFLSSIDITSSRDIQQAHMLPIIRVISNPMPVIQRSLELGYSFIERLPLVKSVLSNRYVVL
jgi:hypothetical protein